jgi:hypothetical protein
VAAAKGYETGEVLLVTAGIVLCAWFQIVQALRVLALRLADRFGASYRAELAGGLVRLLLAAILVASALLKSWLGVLTSAAGSAAVALLARTARQPSAARIDLRPYRRKVLRYLLPTLPGAAYYAIQGPLVVWLSAAFGSTRNIAEVGALGRLGLVVGLFSGLTGTVFLPRLARVTDDRHYRQRYLQFGGLLAAAAASLFLLAAVVPQLFLSILGPKFAGLQSELLLVIAGSGLSLLDGYAVNVNLARSWTRWQGAALTVQIALQALLVALLPLGSTFDLLLFNLLSAGIALSLQLLTAIAGFARPGWVLWS